MYLNASDANKKEKVYVLREVPNLDLQAMFDGVNLEDIPERVIAELDGLSKLCTNKYGEVKIQTKVDYPGHDGGVEIEAYVYSFENDKEFKSRLEQIQRAEALAVERAAASKAKQERKQANKAAADKAAQDERRALYEKLRAEFGEDDTNPSTSLDSLGL